jgi:hypothetical protein
MKFIVRFFKRALLVSRIPDKGPTVAQLAGALLGMHNLDEEYLPKEWKEYADKNPAVALCMRRSIAELRTPTK